MSSHRRRLFSRGFTLVELMIVVAIIGILASVAIPSFIKYIRRSKTTEATMNVRKMYEGLVSYYAADHSDGNGGILPKQFPDPVGWTPAQGACCPAKCPPSAALWNGPSWSAINFGMDDPHYFSYQISAGAGTGNTVGDFIQLEASGDLNCDGAVYSLFRRTATVEAQFGIGGGGAIFIQDELE
jgi:prepilin-type N-terminal cleavage/methylation domain-containing protein